MGGEKEKSMCAVMNSFDSIQWRCHFHQLFIRRLRLNTSTLFRQILCVVIYVYARKVFSRVLVGRGKKKSLTCTIVARDVPANVTGSVSMLPRSIDFINASIPCTVYIQMRRTLLCWNSSTKKKHIYKKTGVCVSYTTIYRNRPQSKNSPRDVESNGVVL